jgi:glycosyltransferase involved in cell wall biosynthesis
MTDMVIANSEAVRQDAVHQEGLPIDKITVIHNGLEASRFDIPPNDELRRFLNFQKGAPVVGVIANFIYYKGHQFFLDAWASVVEKFPEAVVLLVGDGPLRQEFEGKVDAMGLKESVRFLGTRQDVPELLAIMNVVVHPSLEEGFSNTILEAMAAGKPVLATDMGGNPEAVVQGETGLLVPPRDSRALADAIIWMLDHPDEAARFGEAGRHRVAEHFEISRMVRQYEELYENLVAERCPGYK